MIGLIFLIFLHGYWYVQRRKQVFSIMQTRIKQKSPFNRMKRGFVMCISRWLI